MAGLDTIRDDLEAKALADRLAESGGVLHCRRDLDRRILFLHKADKQADQRRGAKVVLALSERGEEAGLKILVTSVRDFLKRL